MRFRLNSGNNWQLKMQSRMRVIPRIVARGEGEPPAQADFAGEPLCERDRMRLGGGLGLPADLD